MYIDIKTFNKKAKNIKINSIIEKNNFNLVRDFITGEIEFSQSNRNNQKIDSNNITNKIMFDNDIEIFVKIGILLDDRNYKKEKEALILLQEKENTLKRLYDTYCDYLKCSYIEEEYSSKLRRQIFYLILELRASLNLNLDKFNSSEIANYCETIANDVVNEKYKRLSFQSHLDYSGKLNRR